MQDRDKFILKLLKESQRNGIKVVPSAQKYFASTKKLVIATPEVDEDIFNSSINKNRFK